MPCLYDSVLYFLGHMSSCYDCLIITECQLGVEGQQEGSWLGSGFEKQSEKIPFPIGRGKYNSAN